MPEGISIRADFVKLVQDKPDQALKNVFLNSKAHTKYEAFVTLLSNVNNVP
jgi:hypothetical protein